MATQFSMLNIINAALQAQRWDQIASTADGSPEYNTLVRHWPLIVESALEEGRYSFSRKEAALGSRQPGKFGYDDSYLTPADALHVRDVWYVDSAGARHGLVWSQDEQAVFANYTDGISIEYLYCADTSVWTATFSQGVQYKLQSIIAQLKEEFGEAVNLSRTADDYFARAATLSSKSRSEVPMYREGRISRARFARG